MKKITIIINNLGIGGAERYVVDSINELLERNVHVELVTLLPEGRNTFLNECNLPKTQQSLIHFKSLYSTVGFVRLIRLLRKQKPNTLITHLWFSNTIGRIAFIFSGIQKCITFEHNVAFIKSKKQIFVDRVLQHVSYKIVAVSETVKQTLVDYGIKDENVKVVYVALNEGRFNPTKILRKDNKDDFVFLFVGSLTKQKNIQNIIRAFKKVHTGRLLIAGGGNEEEAVLHSLVDTLSLKERIEFLGIVTDIPSLMESADCLVFPSRWEGVGLVAVEALLSGVPVITTTAKYSATAEFVKNGYNGITIENPDDTTALTDAMNKIIDDDSLRERLAINAPILLIDFSIEHNIDQILSLCK
ncbi:glycosyltransferase family 4 protein [Candidatus Kaiserbacteria bacterium]|nr:glycosyltransferase family 4 protein [Candidatus Kaiserbacteria bacterium]